MSKYDALWKYVQNSGMKNLKLTFEEIQNIAGIPVDHSFLKYKKELVYIQQKGGEKRCTLIKYWLSGLLHYGRSLERMGLQHCLC